jgi:hypothetical protein
MLESKEQECWNRAWQNEAPAPTPLLVGRGPLVTETVMKIAESLTVLLLGTATLAMGHDMVHFALVGRPVAKLVATLEVTHF